VLAELDPVLYAIPWLESLFADNLKMHDALRVLDIMLALDARFLPFLCVAVLTKVRLHATVSTSLSPQRVVFLLYISLVAVLLLLCCAALHCVAFGIYPCCVLSVVSNVLVPCSTPPSPVR
jgi:hypothetical protein